MANALTNVEALYYQALDPGDQERWEQIRLGLDGLGIAGCQDCTVPPHISAALDMAANSDADTTFHANEILGKLVHFAIELNSYKNPENQRHQVGEARLDKFDEKELFTLGATIGIADDELSAFSESFQACIGCPKPLSRTGRMRTFDEAKVIFESEKAG